MGGTGRGFDMDGSLVITPNTWRNQTAPEHDAVDVGGGDEHALDDDGGVVVLEGVRVHVYHAGLFVNFCGDGGRVGCVGGGASDRPPDPTLSMHLTLKKVEKKRTWQKEGWALTTLSKISASSFLIPGTGSACFLNVNVKGGWGVCWKGMRVYMCVCRSIDRSTEARAQRPTRPSTSSPYRRAS